jgi:Mg2+-importing ATPase
VIVKRLDAIQNFGAMDVLCTDKTGTLTQDRSRWSAHRCVRPRFRGRAEVRLPQQPLPDRPEEPAGPCGAGARGAAESLRLSQDYRKVDEIPFDFERRRMSVVVPSARTTMS